MAGLFGLLFCINNIYPENGKVAIKEYALLTITLLCTLDMYTYCVYNCVMIKSFADKETEKVYNQIFSKKIPEGIQKVALRKLIMINNAARLEDLRVPPNNRLEALTGDRKGQYSIRVNDQFRICFKFLNNDCYDVEIVDYH